LILNILCVTYFLTSVTMLDPQSSDMHWEQATGQVHFTYRWNTSLARGSVVQIGSRHIHVGCCPDTRFEDTPFEMLIKSILSWGVLSTSPAFCENNPIRTRSNIIGFIRFVLVQPTDKACCQFFQPCRCLNGVSQIVANCTVHEHASGSLT